MSGTRTGRAERPRPQRRPLCRLPAQEAGLLMPASHYNAAGTVCYSIRQREGEDMALQVGIDTGGTFTDLVVYDDERNEVRTYKTASTPAAPGSAFVAALRGAAVDLLRVDQFVHGASTVATNALVERKGAAVAFVTTAGFEDTLFIQRINRPTLYDLQWEKPWPLVRSRRH